MHCPINLTKTDPERISRRSFLMDDPFPKSVVAHGGVFAWPDGRENPDTFQALLEYPKGFPGQLLDQFW